MSRVFHVGDRVQLTGPLIWGTHHEARRYDNAPNVTEGSLGTVTPGRNLNRNVCPPGTPVDPDDDGDLYIIWDDTDDTARYCRADSLTVIPPPDLSTPEKIQEYLES